MPGRYAAFEVLRALVETGGAVRSDDDLTIDARFVDDVDRYEFGDVAAGHDYPVANVHGSDDQSVSVGDSVRAAENLGVDLLLQKYVGEGHGFSWEAEATTCEQLFDWLDVFADRDG